jgi:hypothetical protein
MSNAVRGSKIVIPESLQQQLHDYRRRVWTTKMIETATMTIVGIFVAFLVIFALDRFFDTPKPIRTGIFLAVVGLTAMIPLAWHRWVWSFRHPEQLARLLRRRQPQIGDQLLGVLELANNEDEQRRSRALCVAAIEQVAQDAQRRDLNDAAPRSRWRAFSIAAGALAIIGLLMAAIIPSATWSAWARLLSPWGKTPRYTFTQVEALPSNLVVPHGEPFALDVKLTEDSPWQPEAGRVLVGAHDAVEATRQGSGFAFQLPSLVSPSATDVRIGDFHHQIDVQPKLRPELKEIKATIQLPDYLGIRSTETRDVRGGTLSAVVGSQATLTATASNPLSTAVADGQSLGIDGATFSVDGVAIDATKEMSLSWRDTDALAGREPFSLKVLPRPDEAPTVVAESLPRQAVILDTEQINFRVLAGDDFGLKQVGLQWKGLDPQAVQKIASGEKTLSAGAPEQATMQLQGVFSAVSLGIEPQPIEVRLWAEDFLPDRPRSYSPPYVLYVLNAEDHAVWVTEQLSKWHRQSLDVRDREMQLHETNKQLRNLSAEEIESEEGRQQLDQQASAERSNGRRLSALTASGEELLRQAARNPEIGVGHLDRWAEMMQVLKDISANRMPSVADLLREAAKAEAGKGSPQDGSNTPSPPNAPKVGEVRHSASGKTGEGKPPEAPKPRPVPSISDVESNQQPANPNAAAQPPKAAKSGRLGFAQTTLIGPGSSTPPPPQNPAQQKLDEALAAQEDLLAEFQKVADELSKIMANLEGTTLVKRLKAASREQLTIANKLSERLGNTFGRTRNVDIAEVDQQELARLAERESASSQKLSYIMDDLEAYFERRRASKFKLVLDDMRNTDVIGGLRKLSEEVPREQGMSIAQAEFWSDTMDRWAEDLVDPACKGNCPGCKTPDSLPPSIVLEALRILEAETNLREETRVAEQSKGAVDKEVHAKESDRLGQVQAGLETRTMELINRIEALPDGSEKFVKDIQLLGSVKLVMGEAAGILSESETGKPAIAAETEAIELLLRSRRINPNGGGGGGSGPGGGGKGTTTDSALALVGSGANAKEQRQSREVGQASGQTGSTLPEEFRAGLDEYFNRLEGSTE